MAGIRFVILLVIMLSAGAKAFTSAGTRNGFRRAFARSMTADAADTSIVDVCSQKIKDALETTVVKVTGMSVL
jgi:hypothetical protein